MRYAEFHQSEDSRVRNNADLFVFHIDYVIRTAEFSSFFIRMFQYGQVLVVTQSQKQSYFLNA